MFAPAVTLYQVIVPVHVAAVVVAFGVTFAYPLMVAVARRRRDPAGMLWFMRFNEELGKKLITPGLAVIVIAGIYLASKAHQWSEFYVQWGLAVAIVLGALGGLFFGPQEKKGAEMIEREIAAAGGKPFEPSAEFQALGRRLAIVGMLSDVLILATIYIMFVKP
jgi:hypothetical protein